MTHSPYMKKNISVKWFYYQSMQVWASLGHVLVHVLSFDLQVWHWPFWLRTWFFYITYSPFLKKIFAKPYPYTSLQVLKYKSVFIFDLQVWPLPFICGRESFARHTILSRRIFLQRHFKTRIESQNVTNALKCGQSWNGRTNKRTDGRTDRRTVRFFYAPTFIWGHKNIHATSN